MARAALIAGIVNLVIFIMFGFFVVLLVCPWVAWDVYGEAPDIPKGCNMAQKNILNLMANLIASGCLKRLDVFVHV